MNTMAEKCDFCSSQDVFVDYDCRDFDADSSAVNIAYMGKVATLHSKGAWAACLACAHLVEARNIEGLVTRALNAPYRIAMRQGIPQEILEEHDRCLREHLRLTYRLFFENRI